MRTIAPGEVTSIVRSGNAFYIAKLEQRKGGAVRPFEDDAVQTAIRDKLEKQQLNAEREKTLGELTKDAVIIQNLGMAEVALAMVMQKYQAWVMAR